jgi:DNA-binding IclR family transcriptional regulator
MGRGYQVAKIRQKLIDVFETSKTGMSGVEISEKLGVNRITMTKYLKVFAAEGFLRQKNIGNTTLWFLEPGQEVFETIV